MNSSHHADLVAAARIVMGQRRLPSGSISINDTAGTVRDRSTGELYAYIAPEWSAMSAEDLLGWHAWPQRLPTKVTL